MNNNEKYEEFVDPVVEYANAHFGIKYLFPYQRLVIANILDSLDYEEEKTYQIVILPTGAGKSLCFQLPAGLLPGITLIIYPLLGLMADQMRRLSSTNIGSVILKGGMTKEETEETFKKLENGQAKILVTNPEMLAIESVQEKLAKIGIYHFVIDEAHCTSEWGDSFRPSYLQLGKAINVIDPKVVTAFTATASTDVLKRIADVIFEDKNWRLVEGCPDRPNISYKVIPCLSVMNTLKKLVYSMPHPIIIFASSRPGTEIIANTLRKTFPKMDVRFYHAGLEKDERTNLENWFMESEDGVLVATCAYGMGMDKKNIKTVLHYDIPSSVAAYLQEAGRAGRDGSQSSAILLREANFKDYSFYKNKKKIQQNKDLELLDKRKLEMKIYSELTNSCRRTYLLKCLGYEYSDEVACSGCDFCENNVIKIAEGSTEIRKLIALNPNRFSIKEAALWMNKKNYDTLLCKEDYEKMLKVATESGLINIRQKGLMKGSLYI